MVAFHQMLTSLLVCHRRCARLPPSWTAAASSTALSLVSTHSSQSQNDRNWHRTHHSTFLTSVATGPESRCYSSRIGWSNSVNIYGRVNLWKGCGSFGRYSVHLASATTADVLPESSDGSSDCRTFASSAKAGAEDDTTLKRWLVVGDGDLSYSSSLRSLSQEHDARDGSANENAACYHLTATVLEDQETHHRVYRQSENHADRILRDFDDMETSRSNSSGDSDSSEDASAVKPLIRASTVQFGIDATNLPSHFPDTNQTFDRIDFNFPHWRGKQNNRYNRQLIDGFLKSAAAVLTMPSAENPSGGEIRIALRRHQGGMESKSLQDWKQSWLVPEYASNHGLLLHRIDEFDPNYDVSSYRGSDRAFNVGELPQRYILGYPRYLGTDESDGAMKDGIDDNAGHNSGTAPSICASYQMSCRHEMRLRLDRKTHDENRSCPHSWDDLVEGPAVFELLKSLAPEGIRPEVVFRRLFEDGRKAGQSSLLVFMVCYSGESKPLARAKADIIRVEAERIVKEEWGISIAKAGGMVSKPFPYYLLPTFKRS